jgi:hypothetical protein
MVIGWMVSGQETIFLVGAGSHSGWIQLYRTSHSLASAFRGVNSETTSPSFRAWQFYQQFFKWQNQPHDYIVPILIIPTCICYIMTDHDLSVLVYKLPMNFLC